MSLWSVLSSVYAGVITILNSTVRNIFKISTASYSASAKQCQLNKWTSEMVLQLKIWLVAFVGSVVWWTAVVDSDPCHSHEVKSFILLWKLMMYSNMVYLSSNKRVQWDPCIPEWMNNNNKCVKKNKLFLLTYNLCCCGKSQWC